jgi:hypothetical protein
VNYVIHRGKRNVTTMKYPNKPWMFLGSETTIVIKEITAFDVTLFIDGKEFVISREKTVIELWKVIDDECLKVIRLKKLEEL